MKPSDTLPVSTPDAPIPQPPSRFGMLQRFSLWVRLFYRWIYARVIHEPTQVQEVLDAAREESIVYLLDSENRHDFLFFNDLCLKTGMPLAWASNGQSHLKYTTWKSRLHALFHRSRRPFSPQELARCVHEGKPILVFLHTDASRAKREQAAQILDEIAVIARQNPSLRIRWIPVGIIWERRAESLETSKFNEIYGTPTRPSSVRRFLSVLPSLIQLFFQIGNPLCLIHAYRHDETYRALTGAQLLDRFVEDIDTMHTQVNGPKVKPHARLIDEILQSDLLQKEIRSLSQSTGQSREELEREARAILEKSSAKFTLLMCKVLVTLLTPLWSLIYNGLYYDTEKFNQIRELSKTHRIVFIPSHKSHIDYLVLSVLMFQNGVLPPHIAAGENLNFFPIGGILRRGGAFFIRRSFRGDRLYTVCIQSYIDKILHEGYPVEFFIEGGRSRTGQVLQPKFGILRMIAQTVQNDPSLPVLIIPCAATYEKVIEDMGYKNEQEGGSKQKENLSHLIRTTKLLISKYGQIYVSFADPIDLNAALHTDDPGHPQTDASLTEDIDVMAIDLMKRINQASTITMSALLSCALLNATTHPVPVDDLLHSAAYFLNLLIERRTLISPILQTALAASRASLHTISHSEDCPVCDDAPALQPLSQHDLQPASPSATRHDIELSSLKEPLRSPILETLKLFKHNGTVKLKGHTVDIEPSGRLQMAFYKNILLFSLIDDITLACALKLSPSRTSDALKATFAQLADIFSVEFAPATNAKHYDDTYARFVERGWLTESSEPYAPLCRCIAHHVTSYKTVFDAFDALPDATAIDESKFLSDLMSAAKARIADHQILPESRSKVIYTHAIQKLCAMTLFDVTYEGRKPARCLHKRAPLPDTTRALMDDLLRAVT